jgi:hypothetical protein
MGWRDRDVRGDRDNTAGALGMVRGQAQRPGHGVTVRDQDGPVDAGRVQYRQQVGGHLGRRVALRRAGRSDRPVPRPSVVTTVNRRARAGTIPFHDRACVIGDAGMSSSAGPP